MPGTQNARLASILESHGMASHKVSVTPACGSYFTGTAESTFSFRIREDRQLMGMSVDSTFNHLCGDDPAKCPEGPSHWLLPANFIKDEL